MALEYVVIVALKNALMQQMGYIGPPMIHNPVSSMVISHRQFNVLDSKLLIKLKCEKILITFTNSC
jgi:hypothetical protein